MVRNFMYCIAHQEITHGKPKFCVQMMELAHGNILGELLFGVIT